MAHDIREKASITSSLDSTAFGIYKGHITVPKGKASQEIIHAKDSSTFHGPNSRSHVGTSEDGTSPSSVNGSSGLTLEPRTMRHLCH